MKYLFIILSLTLSTFSYAQVKHNFEKEPENTNCHTLPTTFESTQEALKNIQATTFRLTETLKISKHLTPQAMKYLSCDGETGYLVVKETDDNILVYEKIPYEVWKGLMETKDPISDYKTKIKANYSTL